MALIDIRKREICIIAADQVLVNNNSRIIEEKGHVNLCQDAISLGR